MENNIDTTGLALATFDGFPVKMAPPVPLVQIVQPFETMARSGVKKIIAMDRGETDVRHELLPPKIMHGKTIARGMRPVAVM